jgi:signal transduction histidine kinase
MVALCDNACHYSAPGDRISIGSQVAEGWLRFWVADTGPGVSAQDQARIFERFSRGSAGGRRSEGAGLGLSIVSAIAAAHGGRVELDSTPGHGARFTIAIPAVTPDVVVAPQGEPWHES